MRDPHDVRMEREAAIQEAIKKAVAAVGEIIFSHSDGSEETTNKLTKMTCRWLLYYIIDQDESTPTMQPQPYNMILMMVAGLVRDATHALSGNLTEQKLLKDYLLTEVAARFMDKVRIIPTAALRRWELEHPEIFETG